uniref:Ribosomal RNA small subunit methyltransferase H n=1 Tax=Ananas comosus var. bracteatus TaxID=296719 RepID=A0A6V7P3K6_ANACO|nr:unnamed protein product [Ananas comosus var. bracteatus]
MMAVTRHLFSLRPPPHLHRRHSVRVQVRVRCLAALRTRTTNKKEKAEAEAEAEAKAAERLTRRTRSDSEFDWDLYRRHAGGGCGGLGGSHVPVMLGEVLQAFRGLRLRSFVDCTLGAAAHSSAIIESHGEMELFVGLDVDPAAHDMARARIESLLSSKDSCGLRAYTHVGNFKYVKSVLGGVDEAVLESGVDGILMDLGMSSMQVDRPERGFSVLADGPLDMRMDPQASLKAENILNSWPENEVGRILRDYGEESNWQFLQKQIAKARGSGGLHTTAELVDLIRRTSTSSGAGRRGWIKTATRVFQALRIAVNDELRTIEDALYACFDCLSSGGRLAVISFHSLEDRIVKRTFLDIINSSEVDVSGECRTDEVRSDEIDNAEAWCKHRVQGRNGTVLTKRPITPSKEEEKLNRRSRSAKLRVLQKA